MERLWGNIWRNMPRGTNIGTWSTVRPVHGVTAIGFDVEPTEEHTAHRGAHNFQIPIEPTEEHMFLQSGRAGILRRFGVD